MTAGTHNPAVQVLVIDGIRITGILEDGITNEPFEDAGEITAGLDSYVFSARTLKGRVFEIACDPTGRGYRDLSEIRKACEDEVAAGNAYPAKSFAWRDPVNGTEAVAGSCYFLNRPLSQGGKAVAANVFRVFVDALETHGENIL